MTLDSNVVALLGPTNTGKTHDAIERMLEHRSAMIGLPLRLLAREVYEKLVARAGAGAVALLTGEERQIPLRPRYWVCTVESMPQELEVEFVAVDEIQLAADPFRGHVFTQRLLHFRGTRETYFLGADSMSKIVRELVPHAVLDRRSRLSTLRYGGQSSLSALNPRSAVVALSTRELYRIAEVIRKRKGGVAVVLGALSPRTRNAQVDLFQSGKVDFLVATDAIGMGLNLDLREVTFANLHKFDGRKRRPLNLQELAQIAGRAGRASQDGLFSTLHSIPALAPNVIRAIEEHRFPAIRRLVWRNHDLDFSSMEALTDALRKPSPRPMLQRIQSAEDYEALIWLKERAAIQSRATSRARVEMLWQVCQIPDYRKLLLDRHFSFLEAVFVQLCDNGGEIDPKWVEGRIASIDRVDGDIDLLMTRLGFIRTWNYLTHRPGWLADPQHWQNRARSVEDRLSDALHEALTAKFLSDVGSAAKSKLAKGGKSSAAKPSARGTKAAAMPEVEIDEDHPFASLRSFAEQGKPNKGTGPAQSWLEQILSSKSSLTLKWNDGIGIVWRGRKVARLGRGVCLTQPDLRLDPELVAEIGAVDGARVLKRVAQALQQQIKTSLFAGQEWSVHLKKKALGPSIRAQIYGLMQNGGVLPWEELEGSCRRGRPLHKAHGAIAGWRYAFSQGSFSEPALRLRLRLITGAWSLDTRNWDTIDFEKSETMARVFESLDAAEIPWWVLGFHRLGGAAIRIDRLERDLKALLGPVAKPKPLADRSEAPPYLVGDAGSVFLGELGWTGADLAEGSLRYQSQGDRYQKPGKRHKKSARR